MKTFNEIEHDISERWWLDGYITLNPSSWYDGLRPPGYYLQSAIYYHITNDLGYNNTTRDLEKIEAIGNFKYEKAKMTCLKLLFTMPKELETTMDRLIWWYRIKYMAKQNKMYQPIKVLTYNKYKKIYGDQPIKTMFKKVFRHKDHPFHDLLKL